MINNEPPDDSRCPGGFFAQGMVMALREQLKAAGGRWDPAEKLWRVAYGAIRGTELEERILEE